ADALVGVGAQREVLGVGAGVSEDGSGDRVSGGVVVGGWVGDERGLRFLGVRGGEGCGWGLAWGTPVGLCALRLAGWCVALVGVGHAGWVGRVRLVGWLGHAGWLARVAVGGVVA